MLFSRILGGLGRAMIAGGVLLLLFVAYQLWGTGVRTSASQSSLEQRFSDQQAELAQRPAPATTAPPTTVDPATSAPPTSGANGVPAAAAGFPAPKPGDPIGRIQIPRIGADFTIIEGVDLRWLQEGPGHFPGTPLPGQPGNAAIAGHRTTWLAPFNRIDELVPLDLISITTLQGSFTYEVDGTKIVSPTQVEILDQVPGRNTITLMACNPKYSAAQRIVVTGRLISNAAPATAPSPESVRAAQSPTNEALAGSTDDLVGGDSSAMTAAILWGLVAAAVWFIAWFIARAWPSWRQPKRWLVFAAGFVVFLVPLFVTFENINRLLPAGY